MKSACCIVLVLFTSWPCPVSAAARQAESGTSVKALVAKLNSADLHVANQAAYDLGKLQAKEAIPALLQLLRSSRALSELRYGLPGEGNLREWVSTDVRATIVDSLGEIGDRRAVPDLERYLRRPPGNFEVFAGNVAHALFMITGRGYKYRDHDGEQKLYEPSPLAEEEARRRFRPDLKATEGLTASLEIEGHDPGGAYWVGDRTLVINLVITNHSKRTVDLDVSADDFQFSSVAGSGERTTTPARSLPSLEPRAEIAVIKPGRKITQRWVVEGLKDSPLSRGWSGYVNIKCVYTNPRRNARGGAMWRGETLISNSVERYYYSSI